MKDTNLLREIESLPPDARKLVTDFISFLKVRFADAPRAGNKPQATLTDEPFIGMWRDRKDMQDSTAWVRELRQRQQRRPSR